MNQSPASASLDATAIDPSGSVEPPVVVATAGGAGQRVVAGRVLLFDLTLLAVWIAASDWLIFRVGTFLCWGMFFGLAGGLLWCVKSLASPSTKDMATASRTKASMEVADESATQKASEVPNALRSYGRGMVIAAIITLLCLKLVWCGSWLQVVCGCCALMAYAMALAGVPPFLPELFVFPLTVLVGAAQRLARFRFGRLNHSTGVVKPILGLSIILPVVIVLVFSTLFVLANPNLKVSLSDYLRGTWRFTNDILSSLSIGEFVFWVASGWLMLGLLYPAKLRMLSETRRVDPTRSATLATAWYAAYRNSLCSLIALFSVYLVFEFSTLWFRTFPQNFYYAGYAHQGAFWLTTALALATVVLSFMFRDKTVGDPRMDSLKRLALVWSIANLLVALAVYNRLFIYIDFNGMTRMRVVGLLGITSVVVGFGWVVLKILRERTFIWLVHRQLWVPLLAIVVYAILPVDWLVNRYNARQVLAGDKAAAVQIIAHRVSAEGILPLLDLINIDDPPVRDGVRALLALWARELQVIDGLPSELSNVRSYDDDSDFMLGSDILSGHATPWLGGSPGFTRSNRVGHPAWTNFQLAEYKLAQQLLQHEEVWSNYAAHPSARDAAIAQFFQYAYQWY